MPLPNHAVGAAEANFAAVVNNYAWSRTEKNYMKRLLESRDQGDDALHTMIAQRPRLPLSMHDLPQRPAISRLLDECAGLP
jgi:hypothetical protein